MCYEYFLRAQTALNVRSKSGNEAARGFYLKAVELDPSFLSVTLGMMNFVNLAHGSFAMLGAYVAVTLMNGLGWSFFATLPCAFLVAAAISVGFERTLFRRLYRASDLQQAIRASLSLASSRRLPIAFILA